MAINKTYMKKISVAGPSITNLEVRNVIRAVKEAWYSGAYKFVKEFEQKFAAYIGVKYAIATSSCTGALHLSALALGLHAGDEVIVPDTTWIATVAPFIYMGVKPVFVDIDRNSWCIDAQKIEKHITRRTKAILPVHLYGHPAEMDTILLLAKKYHLYVIEDAAQSVGSTYKNRRTGSMGDVSCFSFHGTKTLTTAEGGILLTNSKKIYDKAQVFNNHGKSDIPFWNTMVGYKYKMTDMQAALGLAQLERINQLVSMKRKIFSWYEQELKGFPGLTLNVEMPKCTNTYWMVTIILDKKYKLTKQNLMKKLSTYNIDSRPFFYPLSSMPPFKKIKVHNPVAYALSDYGINLPCNLRIKKNEVQYVCKIIKKILNNK